MSVPYRFFFSFLKEHRFKTSFHDTITAASMFLEQTVPKNLLWKTSLFLELSSMCFLSIQIFFYNILKTKPSIFRGSN